MTLVLRFNTEGCEHFSLKAHSYEATELENHMNMFV